MGIQLNGNNDNISAVDGDLSITGIVTFSQLDVGNNIKFGNAGVVTATSFVGSGANLTGISGGVSGIDTTGQSHLKLLFVNAGVVTFTNTSNPTPSSTLPSGTGGTLYSFDNALNIVGGAGLGGSGGIIFKEGGFTRWRITSGALHPHGTTYNNLGNSSNRVGNAYIQTSVDLVDNAELRIGSSDDLKLYHNGSQSYVANSTGNLNLTSAGAVVTKVNSSEDAIVCHANGSVDLYHDNSKTAYTHGSGFNIKGGNTSDQTELLIYGNEGQDASILLASDDGDDNADFWRMYAQASDNAFTLKNYAAGSYETSLRAVGNGAVELYNDNEIVFKTSSSQVQARRRIQIHADAPGSGHGMSIGQWDGSNHRLEGDSNRPMMITSYNSTGIKMGVSGANKVAVNSHGIVFNGDTSADNALDDYEEGSFTPYLRGNNNNSSPQINGNGSYVKVGRMVYVNVHFANKNGTHLPSGEYVMLYNLPFTHNSGTDAQIHCPFTYKVQFNSSYQYMGYIPNNNTVVWFYYNRNNATWQPWGTDQWRQSQIYATSSFTYKTSA